MDKQSTKCFCDTRFRLANFWPAHDDFCPKALTENFEWYKSHSITEEQTDETL